MSVYIHHYAFPRHSQQRRQIPDRQAIAHVKPNLRVAAYRRSDRRFFVMRTSTCPRHQSISKWHVFIYTRLSLVAHILLSFFCATILKPRSNIPTTTTRPRRADDGQRRIPHLLLLSRPLKSLSPPKTCPTPLKPSLSYPSIRSRLAR